VLGLEFGRLDGADFGKYEGWLEGVLVGFFVGEKEG